MGVCRGLRGCLCQIRFTSDVSLPSSYDSCDVGTMPNQTNLDGSPSAVTTSSNAPLSYQPGQKLSACTCPGEEHPGPSVKVGRGGPEIDIIEAQSHPTANGELLGSVSQSAQIAPYGE